MKKISQQEYEELTKQFSPKTPHIKTLTIAFLVGGLICTFGEAFLNLYEYAGFTTDESGLLTSLTLAFIAAILTGIRIYDRLAKNAGAGTLVPITGFANSVVAPALEFKSEGFILGVGAKMFVIAGPVIVYGVAASVVCGLILHITGVSVYAG